jgi:hypothetical protein
MSTGSVEDAKRCAAVFLNDIRTGNMKDSYQTAST